MNAGVRLDFSRLQFYGREQELQQLHSAFSAKTPVLLEGSSGSGKSTLINAFVGMKSAEVFCGRGKFEQTATEPFAAIVDAVSELVECLIQDRQVWRERIQNALEEAQVTLLQTAVPKLSDLFEVEHTNIGKSTTEFAFERLRFAIRALLTSICEFHPVILALDDLQWASEDSAVLLETIISEENLFFIGAHRPATLSKGLTDKSIQLQLGSLDRFTVSDLIADLVRQDHDEVEALAGVVCQKTGGNAFFVVQFLSMLEQKGLLVYNSKGTYRWEWDAQQILAETDVAENVLGLLADRIRTLPDDQQQVLVYAAAMGSSCFQSKSIAKIMNPEDQQTIDKTEALCIDVAKTGLVENLGSSVFKFAHDRIREASYSLLQEGRPREELHLKIGRKLCRQLVEKSESSGREALQFQAVSQMNRGHQLISDPEERVEVAEMNCEVADLAVRRSAFFPASDFLKSGVLLLGENPWDDSFDLMMKLSLAQTWVHYCCGRREEVIVLADTVLRHARSFEDKRDARHTKIAVLMQQRPGEAVELVRATLAELGQALPRRFLKFHTAKLLFKLKKMSRDWSDQDYLDLPIVTDKILIEVMECYRILGDIFAISQNHDLQALSMLRCFELTLKHGFFSMSCIAVCSWGMVFAYQGRFDEALRFGRLSLKLADQTEASHHRAMTMCGMYHFIDHWRHPVQEGLDPLLESSNRCWRDGHMNHVFMCTSSYLQLYFYSGLKLAPLEKDVITHAKQLLDYQKNQLYQRNSPFFQLVSNLTGSSKTGVELTGEFFDLNESVAVLKASGDLFALDTFYICRMLLAYLLDDFATAEEMSSMIRKPMGAQGPSVLFPIRKQYQCLIALALLKRTGRRKFRKQSRNVVKDFKQWVQDGAVNCHHIYLLLLAEQATVSSSPTTDEAVRRRFDEAIAASARSGFLSNHALANERAGVYFLCRGDHGWATTYLNRAHDLYLDWGAMAKVWHMEHKYKDLLSGSTQVVGGSVGLKARSRLDDTAADQSLRMSTVLKVQQ